MNPQLAKSLSSWLFLAMGLSSTLPGRSLAQTELRADKQLFQEITHGTVALRKGPGGTFYILTRSMKPGSSLWASDDAGSTTRQIVRGGTDPTEMRLPKDFALDRDGTAVVVDGDGSIKIFARDGKLTSSFKVDRSVSVGVLSDGRILVSGHGLPQEHLMSIFDRRGNLLGHIGETIRVEDAPTPFFNAVLNTGSIVVDEDDNIYYVFRFLLTPTVRKYSREGNLVAEWHPESADLEKVLVSAKKTYEEHKEKGTGTAGGKWVLTAGAFDSETKTLWVASGSNLMQLDSAGKTIRSVELLRADQVPVSAQGLLVDRDFIRAASELQGTYEFLKPH